MLLFCSQYSSYIIGINELKENLGEKFIKVEKSEIKGSIAGGLNHLPYLISILVSMAVIKDFLTNYMKARLEG